MTMVSPLIYRRASEVSIWWVAVEEDAEGDIEIENEWNTIMQQSKTHAYVVVKFFNQK